MSGPLDISLKNKLLFIESLLIPAFNLKNKLDTPAKRDEWLANRAEQKKRDPEVAAELIERYGTVNSLEEAKAERTKVEGLLEKAEENERKQGRSKHHSFRLVCVFSCLSSSCIFTCCLTCVAFFCSASASLFVRFTLILKKLPLAITQVQFSEIIDKLDKLKVSTIHIKKNVDKINWIHTFADFCPWLDMAETERSRANDLRKKVFAKLGITDATATCWVTGKHVAVKNAHILPDSTTNKIMHRLELEPSFRNDVNAVHRNFMILDVRLEDAFDSMKISFSPVDLLHTDVLRLKIWDPACRDDPVEVGNAAEMQRDVTEHGRQLTTIGDYEGFPLNIPASWTVSRRALSYHTLCCYIYQKHKDNLPIDENEPADFSSQSATGRDKVRRQLAELFKSSIREDDDGEDSVGELDRTLNEVHEDRPIARRDKRRRCVIM